MLAKYILVSFIGGGAILAAVFVLIATLNDRHGGPAPLVALTVDARSLTPSRIELDRGHLVELQLVNNAPDSRVMSTNTTSVEQLPVESNILDHRNASVPLPYVQIFASAGNASSALVRFTEDGEYELRVETAGRPETRQIATVIVR